MHDILNINKNNAEEVADAINSDSRFSDLFTTHGVIRFVDRFVNFDSNIPLDEQCTMALDKLEDIVKIAVKENIDVQTYKPNGRSVKYKSPRLIISPEYYDEEAQKIFGTTPLIIGICENQSDPNYYKKQSKKAIIHTIFTV